MQVRSNRAGRIFCQSTGRTSWVLSTRSRRESSSLGDRRRRGPRNGRNDKDLERSIERKRSPGNVIDEDTDLVEREWLPVPREGRKKPGDEVPVKESVLGQKTQESKKRENGEVSP